MGGEPKMTIKYWLVKSEPDTYSFEQLVKDKRTVWDGIRSFEARNNLRAMSKGDLLLFYHSNVGKEVVGLAKVVKEAYADPKAEDGDWSVVEIAAVKPLKASVTLATIKGDKKLANFALVKRSRLSVVPATQAEFERILELGETKL
jgi:predicted RNA-binding protein with PUA-like domain